MKWPEKYFSSGDYERGCDDAIDACRATFEKICDRKVLAKIIFEYYWPGSKWEGAIEIDRESSYNVADAIRRHLGLGDCRGGRSITGDP